MRREVVRHLQGAYQVSERRACHSVGFYRSSQRYRSRRDPQTELRIRLRDLAPSLRDTDSMKSRTEKSHVRLPAWMPSPVLFWRRTRCGAPHLDSFSTNNVTLPAGRTMRAGFGGWPTRLRLIAATAARLIEDG